MDDGGLTEGDVRRLKAELGAQRFHETPPHILKQLSRQFSTAGKNGERAEASRIYQEHERDQREKDKAQGRADAASDNAIFIATITAIDQRITELEQDMAAQYAVLEERYGEDVIGGMAARFLDEETLAGLKTDEERMEALRDYFLHEDGTVRSEFKGLTEAQYIRNWNEHKTLAPLAEKYRNHTDFTPQERAEISDAVARSSVTNAQNFLVATDHQGIRDITSQELDKSRMQHGELKLDTGFAFD
ncbi:MAG: hypothetical protein Tsb002_03710 [Wenzhouxiangellaceae bacterium]